MSVVRPEQRLPSHIEQREKEIYDPLLLNGAR